MAFSEAYRKLVALVMRVLAGVVAVAVPPLPLSDAGATAGPIDPPIVVSAAESSLELVVEVTVSAPEAAGADAFVGAPASLSVAVEAPAAAFSSLTRALRISASSSTTETDAAAG